MQKHADSLVYSRTNYGEAILCYARSRRTDKLRELAQSLFNFSIIQSAPYPSDSEMDPTFQELTKSPQSAVDFASSMADQETAYHFIKAFGGYTVLRTYYHLRDASSPPDSMEVDNADSPKEAASSLIELIKTATADIHNGDLSPDADFLVPTASLLSLLGEAYAFITSTSP
jgi:hypothetical protein